MPVLLQVLLSTMQAFAEDAGLTDFEVNVTMTAPQAYYYGMPEDDGFVDATETSVEVWPCCKRVWRTHAVHIV